MITFDESADCGFELAEHDRDRVSHESWVESSFWPASGVRKTASFKNFVVILSIQIHPWEYISHREFTYE